MLKAYEKCLKKPRAVAKIGAPTVKMAQDITELNLADLLEYAPPEFHPRKSGSKYYIRNPIWRKSGESLLHIVGCDHKRGDLLRGTGMDFCALDEAGYIENLEYIRKSVIAPQFDRTDNPEYLILSTPPESLDHDFTNPNGVCARAIADGRHITIPGSSNTDFSENEQRKFLDASGTDVGSVEYRREIECEHVSDESKLIVPEFLAMRDTVLECPERPEHFVPWVCMDTGWVDYCAVLFGYLHFERQLLVIEDMLWYHYRTTGQFAAMIREKMAAIYGARKDKNGEYLTENARMVADMTEQQLNDFKRDHNLFFKAVDKHDRDAAISTFRTKVQGGRIRINEEKCKPLVYQLENGVWNDRRTDFKRSETLGHCDALMAAVYLNRMVIWDENPAPSGRYNSGTHFVEERPLDIREDVSALLDSIGLSSRN